MAGGTGEPSPPRLGFTLALVGLDGEGQWGGRLSVELHRAYGGDDGSALAGLRGIGGLPAFFCCAEHTPFQSP